MICYVNVHPHIDACISLWDLVPTWSLGSVEAWLTFRTDQGSVRVAGPGVTSAWAREALGESLPSPSL